MLDPSQRAALASLRALWPNTRIVIIGATALRLQQRLPRTTADVDLVLALDVAAFPGALEAHPNWARDPRAGQPQRWLYRQTTRFDLLPVGPDAVAQGYLTWPNGIRMSVEAFGLLLSSELPMLVEEERVYIAPVPLVILLKMVAWLERPAERGRDIDDLAWLFKNYLDPREDVDFDRLLGTGLFGKDDAQALLLGQDIAKYEGGREIAARFIHQLEGHYAFQYVRARRISYEEDSAFVSFKYGLRLT